MSFLRENVSEENEEKFMFHYRSYYAKMESVVVLVSLSCGQKGHKMKNKEDVAAK